MSKINCYEARLKGIHFEFLPGIKVDEIANGKMYINGLGNMFFEGAKQVTSKVEEIFAGEEGVWVGEIKGAVFIFQAGITRDNNHIVPISEEPGFSGTKYVQLCCDKEDDVIVLGDGRVIFRLFIDDGQNTMLELKKEAVVTVSRANGSTAIFECTDTGFKIV